MTVSGRWAVLEGWARGPLSAIAGAAGSAIGAALSFLVERVTGPIAPEDLLARLANAAIEPLSPDLVRRALGKHFEEVLVAENGELRVDVVPHRPGEVACRVTVGIEGDRGEYVSVRVFGDRVWDASRRMELLLACDAWSREYRFPRLHLHETRRGALAVVAEGQLAAGESGVHQALLEDFIGATIGGAIGFWEHLVAGPLGDTRAASEVRRDPLHASTPRLSDEDIRRLLEGQ